ncbi:hypothetical protein FGO68_gene10753 [Halteria grandinella]|uniref:Uncharacterized protein n=1 Tax=Halteria grandinella TaxID=5974 RepID=A0A8J8NHQ2_HALGN|nr:hypothetical protein FGO68_gene10753 [Halteria grandinella]
MENFSHNPRGLRTLNTVALGSVIMGYLILGIYGYAHGLHQIMYIGSIILSILNGLFYMIGEDQRRKIIENRIFTVYLPAGVVIFFALFDAIWLGIHGIDFMINGFSSLFYWLMSIAFICLVVLQAGSFFLVVRRAAWIVQTGGPSLLQEK